MPDRAALAQRAGQMAAELYNIAIALGASVPERIIVEDSHAQRQRPDAHLAALHAHHEAKQLARLLSAEGDS